MTRNPPPTARPATGPGAGAAFDPPAALRAGLAPIVDPCVPVRATPRAAALVLAAALGALLAAPHAAAAGTAAPAAGDRTSGATAVAVRAAPAAAGARAPGRAAGAALDAVAPAAAERESSERAALDVRPAPAPAAGPLAAWHRRYLPAAAPVRAAMKRLLAARRTADPTDYKRRYRQACGALAEALAPFEDPARRDALFPAAAADPAANYHLRRAYAGLARAAAAGSEGGYQTAELAFADAARWFRQAARVLERYGLEP